MIRAATALLVAALSLAAFPCGASAGEWKEGTPSSPFRLADAGGLLVTSGADPSLTMPYLAATVFDGKVLEFEPRSVRQAKDGSFLIACGKHGYVLRVLKNGSHRIYSAAQIPGLERPFDAFPLDDGGMLIVDRGAAAGEGRVIRVDASNREVWRYGGASGLGAGQIWDPFTAEPLVGGTHTLIADSLGFRVIEIDNQTGAIVWSYGTYKVEGPGPGLLRRPHSAQRLSNGNTLICDAEGNRILEVTPSGQTAWSYGTGTGGQGPGQVLAPNSALRTANGDTIISDSDNNRVLVVDGAGRVTQQYGVPGLTPSGGALSNPRAALRLANGSTVIADLGNMRLASYGYRLGSEYVAKSQLIDPAPGTFKLFKRISVAGNVPAGASVVTEYTTDGSTWKAVPAGGALPAGTTGSSIRYRLRFKTANASVAPSVRDIAITWEVTTPVATRKSDTTTTATTTGTSSQSSAARSTGGWGSGTGIGGAVAPRSGSPLYLGTADSAGGAPGGTLTQTRMSGWVMSETEEDVRWAGSAASGKGPGESGKLQGSAAPAAVFLAGAYLTGIAWSPGSRVIMRLVAAVLSH